MRARVGWASVGMERRRRRRLCPSEPVPSPPPPRADGDGSGSTSASVVIYFHVDVLWQGSMLARLLGATRKKGHSTGRSTLGARRRQRIRITSGHRLWHKAKRSSIRSVWPLTVQLEPGTRSRGAEEQSSRADQRKREPNRAEQSSEAAQSKSSHGWARSLDDDTALRLALLCANNEMDLVHVLCPSAKPSPLLLAAVDQAS